MTLRSQEFILWVQDQELRPLREQIRAYLEGKKLAPTKREYNSLENGMYARLRKTSGVDFPTIAYTPSPRPAPRVQDKPPIKFSDSTDLAPVKDAVVRDGYALVETTNALTTVQETHATANASQQKSVSALVKTMNAELTIVGVKLTNAEELSRRDREMAADLRASLEDARRDKIFLQELFTKGRSGGNSVV